MSAVLYRVLLTYALGKGFLLGLWRKPSPMVPTGPGVVRVKADYRVMFDQRRYAGPRGEVLGEFTALPLAAWTSLREELPKQPTGGETAYRAWFGDATP